MDGNGPDYQTEHVHDFVQRPEPADAVAETGRNYAGWVVLAALFGLLIIGGLAATFAPKKEKPKNEFVANELGLRLALRQKQLLSMLPSNSSGGDAGNKAILDVADELKDKALTDPAATRIYVAALGEAKQKVDPKYSAVLLKSGNIQDRAFARLYASESLPRGAADRLLTELKGDDFALQVARVHAREKAGITPTGREELAPAWKAVGLILMGVGATVIFGLSICAWVVFFTMRANGTIKPLGLPTGTISLQDADRLAMLGGIVLAAFLVLGELARALSKEMPGVPAAVMGLVPSVGILIFLFAIQYVSIFGKRIRLSDLGVNGDRFGKNLLWGFGGFVAELPLMALMGWIGQKVFSFLPPPEHPASTMLQNRPDLVVVVSVLIFGATIAPFWEEIAFRGMMLPAFTKIAKGNIVVGVLFTSFLFAAIHPQGLSTLFALMTVAAASCALAYHTKSLVPSIVMHALHNATLLILTLIMF